MLLQALLSALLLSTAVHSRVLDSNVDCTILLSCMDNEDCVRIYLRRFALDYCLDGDYSSGLEKRTSSLKKILQSNLGIRMSGGKK
ncbi:hypothetical protein PRIPAC_70837 [Pristionchus pacificus]|uniref:Uncharacterized protein n=1 Tax=Pristionchus pacificus TaxID=54126 RepID=A0A454XNX4_PRIPA|nr:hypothetical protein PRIPAC_70837 [Pristionchus pacificus]|eukprot:PDM72060.1 hypothetical protein PRIPAC_38467 [Pristionchus pacificus]